MVTLLAHQCPVRLEAFHDLSFLNKYGTVFCAFDALASGNLCFGVEKNGRRYFIKYAGAPVIHYTHSTVQAAERLRTHVFLYKLLSHPVLIPLLDAEETKNGFLTVAPWEDAYAVGPWRDSFERMRRLDFTYRLAMLDSIFSFFCLSLKHDYVPICIDDRHLLIDENAPRLLLSSVNHFVKMPDFAPQSDVSRISAYTPPELFSSTVRPDERSAVYTMGQLALTFIGTPGAAVKTGWLGTLPLLELVQSAVSPDPDARPQSAEAFLSAWRAQIAGVRG